MKIVQQKSDTPYNYSDLDILFKIHPIKKDLTINKDIDAVFKSLRNLILTAHYERPFHPEIGSNVNKILFELDDGSSYDVLKKEIEDVIINFEPRININYVNVYNSSGIVMVDISFYLKNSKEPSAIKIPLYRNNF